MGENLSSYTFDKGLITRTYQELKKVFLKKINNALNKWPNELNSSQKKYKLPKNT
jgi:hypothetical protein